MELLIIRLLTMLNSDPANTTYFHIGRVLIDHYSEISSSSISEMAAIANVSKSTMSKFARFLGFDDYRDLKDSAEFAEKRRQYANSYANNIMRVLDQNGHDQYFDAIINDIKALKQGVDIASIDQVALALNHFKRVAAFGLMFSESAAIDLQYKLAYSNKFIYTTQDDRKQTDYIRQADEEDLIIIFTNSGNFLRQKQLLPGEPTRTVFEHTKARIVAITSNPQVAALPFVKNAILFPHLTNIQTHAFSYQIITDLIVMRYRQFTAEKN